MLEAAKRAVDALPTQQCAALHRHGRDGGGGAQGGARRPRDPYGGGPAGRAGPAHGHCRRASRARPRSPRYTESLGIPSLRARIARHYRGNLRSGPRSGPGGGDHRFLRRLHPGLPCRCSSRATGWRWPIRAIRRTGTSSSALGCEPVLIETRPETRWALTPKALIAEHRKQAAARPGGGEPRQSDRHHDRGRWARRG